MYRFESNHSLRNTNGAVQHSTIIIIDPLNQSRTHDESPGNTLLQKSNRNSPSESSLHCSLTLTHGYQAPINYQQTSQEQ